LNSEIANIISVISLFPLGREASVEVVKSKTGGAMHKCFIPFFIPELSPKFTVHPKCFISYKTDHKLCRPVQMPGSTDFAGNNRTMLKTRARKRKDIHNSYKA
jgi:hypothetical protein